MWGLALTPTIVNGSNFGFMVSCKSSGIAGPIDFLMSSVGTITVTTTINGGPVGGGSISHELSTGMQIFPSSPLVVI